MKTKDFIQISLSHTHVRACKIIFTNKKRVFSITRKFVIYPSSAWIKDLDILDKVLSTSFLHFDIFVFLQLESDCYG
jgi:hypothetical protein